MPWIVTRLTSVERLHNFHEVVVTAPSMAVVPVAGQPSSRRHVSIPASAS